MNTTTDQQDFSHCGHTKDCENRCQHQCCWAREDFLEKSKEDSLLGKKTLELQYSMWMQKLLTKQIPETCPYCKNWIKENDEEMQKRYT